MPTRQARHQAAKRKAHRKAGLCAFCDTPSKSYRCGACQAKHLLTQHRRNARQRPGESDRDYHARMARYYDHEVGRLEAAAADLD